MAAVDLPPMDPYAQLSLDKTKQQIRLFKVIKSTSEAVGCTMEVFDLDTAPPYTALSYRWGSTIAEHPIHINGHFSLVSDNLFDFLETYRREEKHEYLWVDQICIAQSNPEERNHQVALMSQIYRRCRNTIVWLCDDRDGYPRIAEEFNRTRTKKALVGLLNDSYFSRLWIVQEVLLASTIWIFTFGNVWISWDDVRTCYREKAWEPGRPSLRALINPDFLSRGKDITLEKCIQVFGGQECVNPKDRVYGFLGIVEERDCIVVDYDKSIDQIYMETVVSIGPLGDTRNKCAEYLGDLLDIPFERREQLIALLDLIQPIHFMGQVSTLRDCSPKTPYGSGVVSSIGLAFAEEAIPRNDAVAPTNPFTHEPFTPAELARSVTMDKIGPEWTDDFNGPDGGLFYHEDPNIDPEALIATSNRDTDGSSQFNPVQAIMDFHRCLHESQRLSQSLQAEEQSVLNYRELEPNDSELGSQELVFQELDSQELETQDLEVPYSAGSKYPSDDWQMHESLAAKVFWTYVGLRKTVSRVPNDPHGQRPKKCRRRWCYGYQGNVYEYAQHPKWHTLFNFRFDFRFMMDTFEACMRARTIKYPRAIEPTGDAQIHWVQRLPRKSTFESQEVMRAALESPCGPDSVCQEYDVSRTITIHKESAREAVFREFPGLRETPW